MAVRPAVATYPHVPDEEPITYLRPVRAETVAGLAEAHNALRNHQLRFATTAFYDHDHDPTASHAGWVVWQDPSVNLTYYVDWKSSPDVTHVALIIAYHRQVSKVSSYIEATLQTTESSPTDLDDSTGGAGIRWDSEDGGLPQERESRDLTDVAGGLGILVNLVWPVQYVTTGWTVDDDPGALPSRPRPLIVPAANAGDELQVKLTTSNARILWVALLERYAEVI